MAGHNHWYLYPELLFVHPECRMRVAIVSRACFAVLRFLPFWVCHSTLQRPGLYWGVRKDDKILAVSFEDHSSLHFPGTRNVAHTKDSARSRRVWLNTPDLIATRCGFFWSVVWRRARVSSKLQEFATSTVNSIGPTSQLPFVSPAFSQQIIVKSKLLIPHLTKLIQIGKSKLPSCCGFPKKLGPAAGSTASVPSAALGCSGSSWSSATSSTFKTDESKRCGDCQEITKRKKRGNKRRKQSKLW